MGCCSSSTGTSTKGPRVENDYEAFTLQYDDQQPLGRQSNTTAGGETNSDLNINADGGANNSGYRPGDSSTPGRGGGAPGGAQLEQSGSLSNNQQPGSTTHLLPDWSPTTPGGGPGGGSDWYRDTDTPRSLYSPAEQSLCAPSMASNASIAFSATSANNVTLTDVDRYVRHVDMGSRADSQMGMSFLQSPSMNSRASNAPPSTSHRSSGGGGSLNCKTIDDLADVETMGRSEIYANFIVMHKMILLAAKRIVPVMRRKTSHSSAAKKAVIVVHHQDLNNNNNSNNESSMIGITTDENIQQQHHHDPYLSMPPSPQLPPSVNSKDAQSPAPAFDDPAGGAAVEGTPFRYPSSNSLGEAGRTSPGEICDGGPPPVVVAPSVYSLEGYTAMNVNCNRKQFKPKAKIFNGDSWDLLSDPDATETLNQGNTLFKFKCTTVKNMNDVDRALAQPLMNSTGFADEMAENNVPPIDLNDLDTYGLHTCIIVRAHYLLPGLKLENLSTKLLSCCEYHQNCQPGSPKVEPDDPERPDTSRSTKTIIKFVFSVKIMMKIHELNRPGMAEKCEYIDGMVPSRIMVFERTKRDLSQADSTVTIKSFLFYYPVTGGVLCTHITVVLNRSVPRVIASVVNTLGNQGAAESAETAELTRAYLIKKFGDSRLEMQ